MSEQEHYEGWLYTYANPDNLGPKLPEWTYEYQEDREESGWPYFIKDERGDRAALGWTEIHTQEILRGVNNWQEVKRLFLAETEIAPIEFVEAISAMIVKENQS